MSTPPRPGSLASRLGQSSTIVVVEDEPDIATFLGAFFRASGTEVIHVNPTAPLEVIDKLVELGAACALVDLNLGGLSGFDILQAVHDDSRVSMTPVVIVTADARPATRERAVGLGAAAFVPKPFNVKDLFATVRALVEGDPLLAPSAADDGDGAAIRRGALRGGVLPADILAERLGAAVSAGRRSHEPVAFSLVRLLGTAAGQPAVTAEVAARLQGALTQAEVLGATAPDELAVLFPLASASAASSALSQAIGAEAIELTLPAGRTVQVRCAAGVAGYPEQAGTGDELYMAADAALAEAVDGGQAIMLAR